MAADDVSEDEDNPPWWHSDWSTTAPAEEWTAENVGKFLERCKPGDEPVLCGIDRTFKRFGVANQFMDVRMLHPVTRDEVKLTLSSTYLYFTEAYHEEGKVHHCHTLNRFLVWRERW